MLTKICEVLFITQSTVDEDCLSVHPILTEDKTVRELFNVDFIPNKDMLLYVYIWRPENEEFIRARLSTCYDTWFLLRRLPINDLERLDFLYTRDHLEDLGDIDSMGIIYRKD